MANVLATALSSFVGSGPYTTLMIGNKYVNPPNVANMPQYWYVAVDLTNLNVVQNIPSNSATDVPPQIQALLGNTQYFLYFIGHWQVTPNIPQGNLYQFLKAVGSGNGLATLEQIIQQIGTGAIYNFSYALAATFSDTDLPGFESWSTTGYSTLAMQFMPVTVGGSTIYAPIQYGQS